MTEEIGRELDQVLRMALMAAGQFVERRAHRSAEKDRAAADQVRAQQQVAAEQDRAAREWARENTRQAEKFEREQQSAARDLATFERDQVRALEREWLDERDASRIVYRPFTNGYTMEKATPEQAAKAWEIAKYWSQQDPTAREAEQIIRAAIVKQFKQEPSAILERVATKPAAAERTPDQTDAPPVGAEQVAAAVEWAGADAPAYYSRHDQARLTGPDGQVDQAAARALVDDHQAWLKDGMLSHETLTREWARYIGQPDLDPAAGVAPTPTQQKALDAAWTQSRPGMDLDEARLLAQATAPSYYTLHDPDRANEAGSLTADMRELRDAGQIPDASLRQEWARHVGVDLAGLEGQARTDAIDTAWRDGVDERGALEAFDHQERMAAAGMDPEIFTLTVQDLNSRTVNEMRQTYSARYAQGFETGPVAEAEMAQTWWTAKTLGVMHPTDAMAADELERSFINRTGQTPQEWLNAERTGRSAAFVMDVAADRAAEHGDQLDAAAARSERAAALGVAASSTDSDVVEAAEHRAGQARSDEVNAETDADRWHEQERGHDTAAEVADEFEAPYDRAEESDFTAAGVTSEARDAVVTSSHGFSQSTAAAVGKSAKSTKKRKARTTRNPSVGRGAERGVSR